MIGQIKPGSIVQLKSGGRRAFCEWFVQDSPPWKKEGAVCRHEPRIGRIGTGWPCASSDSRRWPDGLDVAHVFGQTLGFPLVCLDSVLCSIVCVVTELMVSHAIGRDFFPTVLHDFKWNYDISTQPVSMAELCPSFAPSKA
jgi:hypothetical protein